MSKNIRSILIIATAAVLLVVVFMRVSDNGLVGAAAADAVPAGNNAWNARAIDSAVSLLKEGNLVLRMGTGAQSHMLAGINRRSRAYSHCGIVLVENGYPFVYHSIGGEENPDARLRRDSAVRFFSALHNSAIAIVDYSFSAGMVKALDSTVKGLYAKRPYFDTKFDLATDDRLYCTEFAWKAITRATADTAFLPTSVAMNRPFVGTDDLYMNSHASIVWHVRFK